jgi:dienelactone hydrolase
MADVVLFHHVRGLTDGLQAFADTLRAAGHTVHTVDTMEGRTFDSLDDGFAYIREVGGDVVDARAEQALEGLPAELVYAGFSLGAMPAQQFAQNRPGARGALLYHGAAPPGAFGPWPSGLPAQIHAMADDEFYLEDVEGIKALVATEPTVELFEYPGDKHLFLDSSLEDYDAAAAQLATERTLEFLDRVG